VNKLKVGEKVKLKNHFSFESSCKASEKYAPHIAGHAQIVPLKEAWKKNKMRQELNLVDS
jgi:hypothetical protein